MEENNPAPDAGGNAPVYRNHITTVVQNIVTVIIWMVFFVVVAVLPRGLSIGQLGPWIYLVPAVVVVTALISLRIWSRTTFTFTENELVVLKDTFFKKETRIQYTKIASVNVRRNILNRIFGTTALLFNINSSVNSKSAEATLTLKSDEADRLREMVSARILKKEMNVVEDIGIETFVDVSNFDVILHGFFGQPTSSSLVGLVFLGYSVVSIFTGGGGLLMSLLIFGISSVLPWIRTVLRYYNYRVYRVGDTITVESGMLNTYRSSFSIKKVNSIRIREPLLARLMGKSLLEAEVVGLADSEGMPLLCPLKSRKTVLALTEQLVPEFLFEAEKHTQPRESFVPTIGYMAIWSAISALAGASAYVYIFMEYSLSNISAIIATLACVIIAVFAPAVLLTHAVLAQRNREFEMGPETFRFVTGAYDRQTSYMRYDKVQISTVSSGPIQRRFGVGRCTVHIMSSKGATYVRSGVFSRSELEKVGDEVMARIRDGRYDYRLYQ
jgi:putative membrane protein